MRARLSTILAMTMLCGACDNSQPTQPSRAIVVRSEAQDQLHKLSPPILAIALRRAIYDSGRTCQRVTEAGYVQEYGNLSMWTTSCGDGRSWAVFVGPDGSAQVRDCREMAQLNLPACVIREKKNESAAG